MSLAALTKQLADADMLIARRERFVQLRQVPLFRDLIEEDFIVHETARAASCIGDANLSEKEQRDCISMAAAGGHLKRYINYAIQLGEIAERERPDILEAIEETRLDTGSNDDGDVPFEEQN